MVTLKKLVLLSTVPFIGIQAFAAPTRTRIEVKPGMTTEIRPTARTKGADSIVRENSGQSLDAFRAEAASKPAARASVAKSADALTEDGVEKINDFSDKLLAEILKQEKDGKNVFITGPAMVSAVTMLTNGATGQGQNELLNILGYSQRDLEKMNAEVAGLLSVMNTTSANVTSKMANAFFADDNLAIVPNYKQLVMSRFKAVAQNVPFEKIPHAAADTVNKWASDATDGMIKKIIGPATAAETAGLLASSVYVKGTWETQFDPNKTSEDSFFPDGQNSGIAVPMMHGTFDVEGIVGHDRDYTIARLPYAGRTASVYIIIPNQDWNTMKPKVSPDQALLAALKSKELGLFHKGSPKVHKFEKEDVSLPKFAIKYTNAELKTAFQALGVDKVFGAGHLTGLSPDPRLYVTYIRMDTALEVDEAGAKAAGVASIGMGLESMRSSPFEFNRPFGIVIRNDVTGVNMFAGVIRNPLQK